MTSRRQRFAHDTVGALLLPLAALLPALLFACAPARSGTSSPPTPQVQRVRSVAVVPLTAGTGVEGLGFAVSEILSRDLALVPRVRVVERARLDAVLKEIGLAATGRMAPQSVPRAGQLLGAERLLNGAIARTTTGASLDVALLDVATGQTQVVYSGRLAMNGIIDAQEQLALQAFEKLGITLTPAERERLAKRPTRRVDALIAFGNGRRADAMGNPAQARTFYAQAVRLDPNFAEAAEALNPSAVPVLAGTPPQVSPPIRPERLVSAPVAGRSAFDGLLDDLMLSVTDRVVRPAAPPAVCPPICPALSGALGTVIVRITP